MVIATSERPVIRIGELARICGVTPEAIRLAEREGRIPAACREGFGSDVRIYGEDDVYRLFAYFHRQSKSLGIRVDGAATKPTEETETSEANRILTVGEVAAILGLPGVWTVRNLERRGVFPAPKRAPITGSRFYSASDVELLRGHLIAHEYRSFKPYAIRARG